MDELAKVRRVIGKQLPGAAHETLISIDATTGQNGLRQAKVFSEAAEVDGVVLTKLDGTAKGGIVLAIARELGIPVKLIGIGESLEDLRAQGYHPDAVVNYLSLLGWSSADGREVLSIPELQEGASLDRVGSADTALDPEKLRWMSGQHIAWMELDALVTAGCEVLLPVVPDAGPLDWTAYAGPDALAPARFGLLEPIGPRLGTGAVRSAATVLVPALAVDRRGTRLGRGAGHYDRTLVLADPAAELIAVVRDSELVDTLPREPHDVPMTAALSPAAGFTSFSPPPAG